MPTYRNDSENTYKILNSNYKAQSVQPGESVATLQILDISGMTKTSEDPPNPKTWTFTVAAGTSFADNVVNVGAALKPKSGYIRSSSKVNLRFNSIGGDTVVFDTTRMGFVWSFSNDDDLLVDKIYFENPPESGAVDIYIEVFATSI